MWKSTAGMVQWSTRTLWILLLTAALAQMAPGASTGSRTRNVIFVMTDGLRWQDVFRGADAALIDKRHGNVSDPEKLKKIYWRDTPVERREALMPFLWQTVARFGQVYGNRDLGSDAYVTNGLNFSYPGYNETLCGFPDPRIHSNDNVPESQYDGAGVAESESRIQWPGGRVRRLGRDLGGRQPRP